MNNEGKEKSISRRHFISRASGAAAALTAAPSVIAQSRTTEYKKSDKLVRIGVVGGRFGAEFQWHEHPHSKVTAVCDLLDDRIQRLKETYRCDVAYKDYQELVADKNVDAVGVFTPLPLHVPMAVQAMEAGKHVISAVAVGINEEECVKLLETVKKTGTIYMMAETSYYRPEIITCRKWARENKFGEIFFSEAEYHHDGIEAYWFNDDGSPTWRHGLPPLHYPTHATGMVVPVTGERLTEVTAIGWGDGAEIQSPNAYNNPFWNEVGLFKTSGGHASRIAVFRKVASGGAERGQFLGTEMSFYMPRPGGTPAIAARRERGTLVKNKYVESKINMEPYDQPDHWEMLPEPLRHRTGHGGSHTFLTHEFVMAVLEKRQPEVDIYESLAYTIPGFYAHKSALDGGKTYKIPDYGRA